MKNQFRFAIGDNGEFIPQGKGLKQFLQKHKGQRGFIALSIVDTRDKKKIIGYYFGYVVPEFQKAYRQQNGENITERLADDILWRSCSTTQDLKHDIWSLDVFAIWLYIEEVKVLTANDFNYYIS